MGFFEWVFLGGFFFIASPALSRPSACSCLSTNMMTLPLSVYWPSTSSSFRNFCSSSSTWQIHFLSLYLQPVLRIRIRDPVLYGIKSLYVQVCFNQRSIRSFFLTALLGEKVQCSKFFLPHCLPTQCSKLKSQNLLEINRKLERSGA